MNRPQMSHKKVAKHLYLSESAIEQIETYMVEQGLNVSKDFSKTMETLALLALGDEAKVGQLGVMQNVVESAVAAQYNRFAKLIAHAAIEAGAAREAAQQLFFLTVVDEVVTCHEEVDETAVLPPTLKQFGSRFGLKPSRVIDQVGIAFYEDRLEQFERVALKRLGKRLSQTLEKLLDGLIPPSHHHGKTEKDG